MDVQTGYDQPTKATDEASIDTGHVVANGIAHNWKASMQLQQAAGDLESFYTATPLPALPKARTGPLHSSWTSYKQHLPSAGPPKGQQAAQAAPILLTVFQRLQQLMHMAAIHPFSNPEHYSPAFLQAALFLLLSVVFVPLGVALQLRSSPASTATDRASSPWAGVLYIAAIAPLLRLLMQPLACGVFYIGEVLVLGWPLLTRTPVLDQARRVHRFSWLLVSLALLAWHSVVFKVVLQQPAHQWTGPFSIDTCAVQAEAQVRYACTYQLVYSYSFKVLCCLLLACTASCISALAGAWLLCRVLAVHDATGAGGVRALLCQELHMALFATNKTASKEAVKQLHLLCGQQQVLAEHEHSSVAPSQQQHQRNGHRQQQQQHKQQALYVQTHAGAAVQATQPRPGICTAAAACTAVAALASLAVCALAVTGVTVNAAMQPSVAVAAAVAVPASAAAAAGAAAELAGMLTNTAFNSAAAVACSCFAAVIACAASATAAVLNKSLSSSSSAAAAATGPLVGAALPTVAGFAFLMTAAAALLQLSVAQQPSSTELAGAQQRQRVMQFAAWRWLSKIMQRCIADVCSSGNSHICIRSSCLQETTEQKSWQEEGSALWQQLVEKVSPHIDSAKVDSVCCDDVKMLFKGLGLCAALADAACMLLDTDQDGNITEANIQALVASTHRLQHGLAATLHDKVQVLLSLETATHMMVQVLLLVLYLAVLGVGAQLWPGCVAALALLVLGSVWVLGDAARQAFSNTSWLLSTNTFNVGDTISYNSSNWCVQHIGMHTTTLGCLATGVPYSIPTSELHTAISLANKSRCKTFSASVKVSIVGMPAAKLGSFIELLTAAAAERAAKEPALYLAGSTAVSIAGDKLAFNGSVDFVEAELLIQWQSVCPGSNQAGLAHAKAGMLQAVREQYSLFLQPQDNTRPMPDVSMWSNPVYS